MEQLTDLAIAGLRGDPEQGPLEWEPGHLDKLKQAVLALGGGPPLHEAVRELVTFSLFLEKERNSFPAARELAVMLDAAVADEAHKLIHEHEANRGDRGRQFQEFTGPQPEAPSAQEGETIEVPKIPRPIRG